MENLSGQGWSAKTFLHLQNKAKSNSKASVGIAVENDAEASERLFTAAILLRDLALERPLHMTVGVGK